jgi:menaquinone-9 beta-reductase
LIDGSPAEQKASKVLDSEIIIIGGGLAGLIAAHQLAKNGREVLLLEKKTYPFHRVCGEYISNEVKSFLTGQGLFPAEHHPAEINRFELSAISGKAINVALEMGGFGISRYVLDEFLYRKALEAGAVVRLQTQVENLDFDSEEDRFRLQLQDGSSLFCTHVIGAFGKRSKVDKALNRDFIQGRSDFIGIKYHIKTDVNPHTVYLHNFPGGYCGLNKIEADLYNLCYLGSREDLRICGDIPGMEERMLWQNPHLKRLFQESEFVFEKPEVINEVNFSPKAPVEDHVLMVGDAAGLITPLCGNGMAIAIHTGLLAASSILSNKNRNFIEADYAKSWQSLFRQRLWVGRNVQKLFGSPFASRFSVSLLQSSNFLARNLIKLTHGQPF